ncbi:hypothetical protein Tco_1000103 [Tanacetum coccineum]
MVLARVEEEGDTWMTPNSWNNLQAYELIPAKGKRPSKGHKGPSQQTTSWGRYTKARVACIAGTRSVVAKALRTGYTGTEQCTGRCNGDNNHSSLITERKLSPAERKLECPRSGRAEVDMAKNDEVKH